MNPKDNWCRMCYSPDNKHQGGFEYKDQTFSGVFCSKECFDMWVQWKISFADWCKK